MLLQAHSRRCFLLGLLLSLATHNAVADSPLQRPSGLSAGIPAAGDDFQSYLERNQQRLRDVLSRDYFAADPHPFGAGYDLDTVVDYRGPYEFRPPQNCQGAGTGMGFMLTHGLTDTPYLLRDVAASLREHYPCALLRGLLLPGHSTVPGDTLQMRHEDWLSVTEFGVNSFRGEVEALYLVGFSTGTSLSVRYMDAHRDDALIKGLIMLSPAIQAKSGLAFLSPYLRWFSDWLGEGDEHDFARYESFSVNAGAEFYLLTRDLSKKNFAALTVPVFMAGSGDDATVDMNMAANFFCDKTPKGKGRMLWYKAEATGSAPERSCEGLLVVAAASPAHRVINFSHTSLSIAPENPHYGLDGDYPVCDAYQAEPELFAQCKDDGAQTVYGERGLGEQGRYQGKLVRRGTFNPHYAQMIEQMLGFIQSID